MKKIAIAGGTGFIGTYLVKRFREMNYEVVFISRHSLYKSTTENQLSGILEGAEVLINLAGKTINCRHTKNNKKEILSSRIDSTNSLGQAIKECKTPPKVWINASAAGIYKPSNVIISDEKTKELATDFLATVVKEWENTFFDFSFNTTRQIAIRTAVVLGKNGGALKPLTLLTKMGLGGKQGNGKQMFSWIHIEDYFQQLIFLMNHTNISGPVNFTAPKPITNRDFMYSLRHALHVEIGIPAPSFAIKIGALIIGTESSLILDSSNVIPQKLLENGYTFQFPTIDKALDNIFYQ